MVTDAANLSSRGELLSQKGECGRKSGKLVAEIPHATSTKDRLQGVSSRVEAAAFPGCKYSSRESGGRCRVVVALLPHANSKERYTKASRTCRQIAQTSDQIAEENDQRSPRDRRGPKIAAHQGKASSAETMLAD